ncbi:hypothetical protein LXL04_018921 [Taraxacum kok-saghyz]
MVTIKALSNIGCLDRSNCDSGVDEANHILVGCPFVREALKWILGWCNIPQQQFDTVGDLVQFASQWGRCPNKMKVILAIVYGFLWWSWKARNNKLFNKLRISSMKLADEIIFNPKVFAAIMDLNDKRSFVAAVEEVEEVEEVTESTGGHLISSNQEKCCTECQTTRTPLWRGGPAGPKSLCNACGIKYNKKRTQVSGFDKSGRTSKCAKRDGDLNLKVRLMVINKKQQKQHQRKRSSYERGKPWWNNLREEEQAAILLMAISCGGSLYS